MVVPPVPNVAAELEEVFALQPTEVIAISPVVPVPGAETGVLGVEVHGSKRGRRLATHFQSAGDAQQAVRDARPDPVPIIPQVADGELIGKGGTYRASQPRHDVARLLRIRRLRSRHALCVAFNQATDVHLVG